VESNIVAPLVLRAYAWRVLKANTQMNETQYEGKTPIVPLSEAGQVSKYAKPYIVYGYSENPSPGTSARSIGSMAFVVRADVANELFKITNVLTRAFERQDDTATDVNEFSSTIPQFIGLRFGTIEVTLVEVDEPEDSEGAAMESVVNIRYEYYTNYDNLVTSVAHWDEVAQKYVTN
jgi:hypothetical protein